MQDQTDQVWHAYLPDARPGLALRLSRERTVRTGERPSVQPGASCCSTPTRSGSTARSRGATRCSATGSARTDGRAPTTGTRRRRCRRAWSSIRPFDWGDDRQLAHAARGHRDLRGPCQGLHAAASGRGRGAARHVRGPASASRRSSTSPGSASPRSSCCRSTSTSTTGPGRARPLELLGLQHDRLLRPRRALQRHRRAGERVQDDGEAPSRRRDRGDPRRRLQPHRRGQPPGPDAELPRASTTPPTTGSTRTTGAGTSTTPAPATRSTATHPRVLQLIMD